MLKEAIIWALLVVCIFFGSTLFIGAKNSEKQDSADILLLFIGLTLLSFGSIYLIFRFFWWLNHITSSIQ